MEMTSAQANKLIKQLKQFFFIKLFKQQLKLIIYQRFYHHMEFLTVLFYSNPRWQQLHIFL